MKTKRLQTPLTDSVTPRRNPRDSKKGSALVMTLLVISLLLVIVAGFSIYVRFQLREVTNHLNINEARANARLAADLAVARLQEVAGVDQRVTLPVWSESSIAASVPAHNQYYTGVRVAGEFVYTENSGQFTATTNEFYQLHLGWLLSGASGIDLTTYRPFTPSGSGWLLATNSAIMVGAGSVTTNTLESGIPTGFVAAPKEYITQPGTSQRVGEMAWVVLEESTKARLNTIDPFRGTVDESNSLLMSQRGAVEVAIPDYDASNPLHRELVKRVYSDAQWLLLSSYLNTSGYSDDVLKGNNFHAVSSSSQGMPINVANGGFKRDLSALAEAMLATTNVDGSAKEVGKVDFLAPYYKDFQAFVQMRDEQRMAQSMFYQNNGEWLTPAQRGLPLRRDQLTPFMVENPAGTVNDKLENRVFPRSTFIQGGKGDLGGPLWSQLLEYATLGERTGLVTNNVAEAKVHTHDSHGLYPTLAHYIMRMRFTLTPKSGTNQLIVRKHFIPTIALWNPYDVAVTIPGTYFVAGHKMSIGNSGSGVQGHALHLKIRHPAWHEPGESYWMPPHQFGFNPPKFEIYDDHLVIPCYIPETTFQPGEVIWFELDDHYPLQLAEPATKKNFTTQTSKENFSEGDAGGFSWFPSKDAVNNGHNVTLDVSGIVTNVVATQGETGYYPMRAGLSADGARSVYLEENLTWRTMTEAGGYAPRNWADWNGGSDAKPSHIPLWRRNRNIVIPCDTNKFFRKDLQEGLNENPIAPWSGKNSTHLAGIPKYPFTFKYSTLANPTVTNTYTFPVGTNNAATPAVGVRWGRITTDWLPTEAPLDTTSNVGWSLSRVSRYNKDHQNLIGYPDNNRWLERMPFKGAGDLEAPYDWPNTWKNKKIFPVRFNEHGIIYSGSPEDIPVPESIAVDVHGITTDWEITMARMTPGHKSWRSRWISGEAASRNYGRGFILFGPDPNQFKSLSDKKTYQKPAFAAFNLFAQIPASVFGYAFPGSNLTGAPSTNPNADDRRGDVRSDDRNDYIDRNPTPNFVWSDGAGPQWSSLGTFDENVGFKETGAISDPKSFGIVFSLRMPDHGLTGTGKTSFQTPWLSSFNPLSNWQVADPLSRGQKSGVKGKGSMAPMTLVGGFTFDSELLSPLSRSPNGINAYIGHTATSLGSSSRAVIKQVPRSIEEVVSIGQLMHANPVARLRGDENKDNFAYSVMKDSLRVLGSELSATYAVGGGRAPAYIPSDMPFRLSWAVDNTYGKDDFLVDNGITLQDAVETGVSGGWTKIGSDWAFAVGAVSDNSFYMNKVLWDDYMFTGNANGRMRWRNGTPDRDFNLSAARMTIEGAFNINSVSAGAWTSLIASAMDMTVASGDAFGTDERIPITRTSKGVGRAFSPGGEGHTYFSDSFYNGYSRLTITQVRDLSTEIVRAVKERGPFYSLEQFVNRDPTSSVLEYRLKSPLQMAIDRSGINGAGRNVVDASDEKSVMTPSDYSATDTSGTPYRYDIYTENIDQVPSNEGAPGTITQQDILSKIGPLITVRGDTFKIRAYGSKYNPVTGVSEAQAWCEVTVQRTPDYVEPNRADVADPDGVDTPDELPSELSDINKKFGRRYQIIRVRWLDPDEI